MNVLSQIISENLINAIGWTILHSIWQGAAIALGFALLMFFLRRYSSRTRYFVGVMALLLVVGISLTTFLNIYDPGTSINMTAAPAASLDPGLSGTIQTGSLYNQGIFSTFADYFKRHLPLIVTLWFLGILVLVLKLAGGFLYNQRVKSYNARPLNKSWKNQLNKLCRKTRIKKTVALLESALVKVPMTIGHMKPAILLPVGMVTGLPRDQVEALLAHELAHILRRDYLVNIMQSVIDILYFYHPGVRWISSQVRTERENCCDDIAVSLSGDSINFARALTNIDGSLVTQASPALTAANKSTRLFGRIKRLFGPRKKNSEFSEGFAGACILTLFIFTLVVSANAAPGLHRDTGKAAETNLIRADYNTDDEKKEEQAKEEAEVKKREEKREERQAGVGREEKRNREERELRVIEREKIAKLEFELQRKAAALKGIDKEKLAKLEMEFQEKAELVEKISAEKLLKIEQELRERAVELESTEREKLEQLEKELAEKAEALSEQVEELEKQELELEKEEKELEKEEAFFNDLKKDLKKDKLIDDAEDFEFKLTPKGLWVNGKKQSKKLFNKYKKMVEDHSGKKLKDVKTFRVINRK